MEVLSPMPWVSGESHRLRIQHRWRPLVGTPCDTGREARCAQDVKHSDSAVVRIFPGTLGSQTHV